MPDRTIVDLLRRWPFAFIGTVEQLGAATMEVPVDDRTAVVRVDLVLHAPDALAGIGGQRITLQLAADAEPPAVDAVVFFAQGLAFGDSIALAEVGRLPVADVEPQVRAAAASLALREPTAAAPAAPFDALVRQAEAARLVEHAVAAAAVVVARVVRLERASH